MIGRPVPVMRRFALGTGVMVSVGTPARVEPQSEGHRVAPFAGVVWNPGVLSRTGVSYLRCRSWNVDNRERAMGTLKTIKLDLPADKVKLIVDDLYELALAVYGPGFFGSVVPVACGHSRRSNCLSAVLAVALSKRLKAPMVRAFRDRFVSGVSHPKEFKKLPPLEIVEKPVGPALVVDDVATSGFHIHEAVSVLRKAGVGATGLVWCAGAVRRS